MAVIHYENATRAPIDEILRLFRIVDKDAAGNTYDESTVAMSQAMFFDTGDDVGAKEALRAFYTEFADEVVVYRDESGQALGFTMFQANDPIFEQELPAYTPHLAVTYSGVHPNHQREGVWTAIRDTIYTVAQEREIPYILTGVDAENDVSLAANKSRGFEVVGETGTVDGTDTTLLLARSVSDVSGERQE